MLHIIFLILKIIGVILLAILGLIVLLLCVLLFVAVKYEGQGKCSGSLQSLAAEFKFHWFFHLVRGHVIYQNEKLFYQIKVAWKILASSEQEESFGNEETEPERETVVTAHSIPETSDTTQAEADMEAEQPDIIQTNAEEEVPDIAQTDAEAEVPDIVQTDAESEIPDTVPHDTETAGNDKNKRQREKITDRISRFFRRIKYTFQKICDKIKKLTETKDKFVDFITDETHKNAWTRVRKEIKRLFWRLNPKQLELDLHFGFEDPSITGKTLAVFGILYPITTDHVQLRPDFEQKILEGEGRIKGRIRVAYFVSTMLHLLLDKHVRMTYKDVRNLR